MTEDWVQVAVRVVPDRVDVASHLLILAGCAGTVVQDQGEEAIVSGYVAKDSRLDVRLEELKQRLRVGACELGGIDVESVEVTPLAGEDWSESWKGHFTPIDVGRGFRIQPSWCPRDGRAGGSAQDGRIELILDPGMAFGTGHHATTRFCLELLEEYLRPGQSVIDIGTGSGILAIAAAKLGAAHVVGLDNDPLAIAPARENVERNLAPLSVKGERVAGADRTDPVTIVLGDLSILVKEEDAPSSPPPWGDMKRWIVGLNEYKYPPGPYDLAVANLTSVEILRLLESVDRILVVGGCLIAAGISVEHCADVEAALQRSGFITDKRLTDEEWVAFAAHLHPLR